MKRIRFSRPPIIRGGVVTFLLLYGYGFNIGSCFANRSLALPPVHPVQVRGNQILLKGSELCPQSLMAINTQLSPSGDVLVWCAEAPKSNASLNHAWIVKKIQNGQK
jgi:hypothetical protein